MPTQYSHSAPYRGTEGGKFNIKPLLEGHCDCGVANDISYVPPFSNYVWNNNACFRTTVTRTFNNKPLYLSHHWGGPGVYELDITFVTKEKFYGDDIASSFDFYSENNKLLHLCCINNYKVKEKFSGAEGDRPPNNLSGIDYIIVDTGLIAPSYLFDWNSEHLSGVGSSLDDWAADKAPQYGVSFWQGNSSYRPTNVQQFIRYDQAKSIDSAVEFYVNDHMLSSTSSPTLVRNSAENEAHFINSGFISLMIVAEPTSGNEDNNLISFFSDSYTSGSGFSLQAISGTSHSGNISLSGTHNQPYYFSYDNVESGPSIYSLSIDNQSESFVLSINDQYITGGSGTIPYEGYYQIGSGFEGKMYQVVGISQFNNYPDSEIIGMLAENWGISNKLPTGNPYHQPKLYGVHILDLSGNFDIEGLQSSYQSGNLARFSISPKRGIQFSGFSGDPGLSLDGISQDSETVDNITRSFPQHQLSILVTGDMILDSYYTDLLECNLGISGSGDHQGAGTYFSGETVAISTSTSYQQKFVEWESGVVNDTYNPNTEITLTGNINLNAKYRNFNNYNVFLQGIGQQSGAGIYLEDSKVSITGYPPIHKNFDSWQVTSGDQFTFETNSNPSEFIITGDIELTANYVDTRYNINTRALYDNGLISGINGSNYFDPTGQTYLVFDSVQLTGIADSGYTFKYWDTGSENYYSGEILNLTVTGDMNVSAAFVPSYELKYQNYTGLFSGGYISGAETGVYSSHSGISLSVVAESGFEFDQWIFDTPIDPITNYSGSGYSGAINFLQTSLGRNAKSQPVSANINGFNASSDLSLFMLNRVDNHALVHNDEFARPYRVPYFKLFFRSYTAYGESSKKQLFGRGGFSDEIDLNYSRFSMNDSHSSIEKTVTFTVSNNLVPTPTNNNVYTDPIPTVYQSHEISFKDLLTIPREQISTNWCSILGSSLNPDNKILTFKATFIHYKESNITTPNIRLELFPDEAGYNRTEEESYTIYDSSDYQSSIKNKSFRGAYFDIKNGKLYKGRAAPNGFSYQYEMIRTFESSEYTEYDISVSVSAENDHSRIYTLLIQPFAVHGANNNERVTSRFSEYYDFKFGFKNLCLSQLPQEKIYNFDRLTQASFDRNLSSDFCATALFRKINNERFQSFAYNLPYTPELLKSDFEYPGSRLFVFGKHQTEAPLPNSFDKDDQYKLGLNPPAGHQFSRYRAVGKGIRSDIGFFELKDQSISLDSLFESRSVRVFSKIKEKKYHIGSDEFYDFFGREWASHIEQVPPREYTSSFFQDSYPVKNASGSLVAFYSTSLSYRYFRSRAQISTRHYYGIRNFLTYEAEAAREQGRDLRDEILQALREIYDNDPLIKSYEIDPIDATSFQQQYNAFHSIFSVNFTQPEVYIFKPGSFDIFRNTFLDYYDLQLSTRPLYGNNNTVTITNQPEINQDFRFKSIDPVPYFSNSQNKVSLRYLEGFSLKTESIAHVPNASVEMIAKKISGNTKYFGPSAALSYFDCKLMQSNIAENSLRHLVQCQKASSRLLPNIEWTSTDAEDISDATFRFRGTTSGYKEIFKIYRVLNTTVEKYVGQMTCPDVKKGEFVINWDGDLSDANIASSNFNRSSNNFCISHGFSLNKKLFSKEINNSFYNPIDREGNIKSISAVGRYAQSLAPIFSKNYGINSKSFLHIRTDSFLSHSLLGGGSYAYKGQPFIFLDNEYFLSRWTTSMIIFLSLQEYMQDYFSLFFPQGNAKRNYLKKIDGFGRRVDRLYSSSSGVLYVSEVRTTHAFGIVNGGETYPGIQIEYNHSENTFSFNNNIIIPTVNSPRVISTTVSQASDFIEGYDYDGYLNSFSGTYLKDISRQKDLNWDKFYSQEFIYYLENLILKNNFLFTNPDIEWREEHYNLLDNVILMCSMFDISSQYNRFARAHWAEATPSSVLEDSNENFTNVNFGDDDIHVEIIYDE